jgi:putative DNA primase/helicase
MRQDFRQFSPTHKLWLAANHKPTIRGTDNGIWRRIRLIPFDVTIPPDEQDRNLTARLKAELPGILNWALRGCQEWQKDGLGLPDEIRDATDAYRAQEDVFEGFLRESCVVSETASIGSTELATAFADWNGTALSQKVLSGRLVQRGFEKFRVNTGVRWRGLQLRGLEV